MIRPCGHPLTWGVHAGTLPADVPAWSGGVINGGNRHGFVNIKGMGPNGHNSMVALIVPHQGTPCTGKMGGGGNPCQGKHRGFGNFAKTQGIWFAQVVNSLILKVKDISIFAAISLYICWISLLSQCCVCNSHT